MSNLRGPAYFLVLLGAVTFGVTLLWHPAAGRRFTGLSEVRPSIPAAIAGYSSPGEEPADKVVKAALGTADISSHTYKDENGQALHLILIAGTDRNALHDPRSCLVGAGWRIENDHIEPIPNTNINARFCRVVGGPGGEAMEIIYLYVVDGQIVTQATQIRSQMLMSALIGKRNRPVCFVRFLRPLSPDSVADTATRKRFIAFVGAMWNALDLDTGMKDN